MKCNQEVFIALIIHGLNMQSYKWPLTNDIKLYWGVIIVPENNNTGRKDNSTKSVVVYLYATQKMLIYNEGKSTQNNSKGNCSWSFGGVEAHTTFLFPTEITW